VWSHPDLLPTSDDLDDPLGFGERDATVNFEIPDDLSELDGPTERPDEAPAEGPTSAD